MGKRPDFKSPFAGKLNEYLDYKESSGIRCLSLEFPSLRRLDDFLVACGKTSIAFSREDADAWRSRMAGESDKAWYRRVNVTKHFFEFLLASGHNVAVFRDAPAPKSTFSPYIYSEEEAKRYFEAVDRYDMSRDRLLLAKIPVVFRILQSCGTRIDETLHIRKRDVDLDAGTVRLVDTKGKRERFVVMSGSMTALMRDFASRTFFMLDDMDFIFGNKEGIPYSRDTFNDIHVKLLNMAGIQYLGDGRGPRLHDWRHTMAVNSFCKLIESGMDTYAALPLLATYLGHGSIEATEKYVRLAVVMYPGLEDKVGGALDGLLGKGGDE